MSVPVVPSVQPGESPGVHETGIARAVILELAPQCDQRGSLTELCRFSWIEPVRFPQWNLVRSRAGVLRGMHWHNLHDDLISVLEGQLLLALSDLRPGSPTQGVARLIEMAATRPAAVLIPPGVAHGFYSVEPTSVLYAVSRYWDVDDELGVAFDDAALGLDWPVPRGNVILSDRDATLPPLADAGAPPPWQA